jgi:hypothetical protein
MANRNRERVCRVVWRWQAIEAEQQLDHVLHLPLVRPSISNDGTLHFCRRVLQNFAARLDSGKDRNAAGVTELERASGVACVKEVLDDDVLGLTLGKTCGQLAMNPGEPAGE